MKRLAFAAAAVLAVVGRPARADEAAANFVKLFSDVCLGKFGHLDKVEDWAADQNLLADHQSPGARGVCRQAES